MGEPPGPLSKMPLAHVTEGKIGVGPEGGMSVGGRRGGAKVVGSGHWEGFLVVWVELEILPFSFLSHHRKEIRQENVSSF